MPQTSSFRPNPDLFPFRSRWFDARAGRVHYIDEGEGPTLLFLHGSPTWSFLYRGVVVRMRRRFRCIAPDYLGFGLSERPHDFGYTPREHTEVMLQLLRHLDLRDVTIMGHEWGGPIAMRMALDETARVRALVLGNTWYWPASGWQKTGYTHLMSAALMQRLVFERRTIVERLLGAGAKHPMQASVLEHYAGVFPTVESLFAAVELPRHLLDSAFWLEEIAYSAPRILADLPVLLTWGVHDRVFSPRLMQRFLEDFRAVSVRPLDARHLIQEDAPAEISEAIERFLAPEHGQLAA